MMIMESISVSYGDRGTSFVFLLLLLLLILLVFAASTFIIGIIVIITILITRSLRWFPTRRTTTLASEATPSGGIGGIQGLSITCGTLTVCVRKSGQRTNVKWLHRFSQF